MWSGDWWSAYGYEIPTIQRMAIRVLSQPCSLHWCRWNWDTFDNLHSKTRSKCQFEKLRDLVLVHCNLWLREVYGNREGKCGAVIFDKIDVCSEWPTEWGPSTAPLLDDDSWLA